MAHNRRRKKIKAGAVAEIEAANTRENPTVCSPVTTSEIAKKHQKIGCPRKTLETGNRPTKTG